MKILDGPCYRSADGRVIVGIYVKGVTGGVVLVQEARPIARNSFGQMSSRRAVDGAFELRARNFVLSALTLARLLSTRPVRFYAHPTFYGEEHRANVSLARIRATLSVRVTSASDVETRPTETPSGRGDHSDSRPERSFFSGQLAASAT